MIIFTIIIIIIASKLLQCDGGFMISNKVWKKTFVSSKDFEGSKMIQEKTDSIFHCNLRANEEKWAHLMCFKGNECLLANKKVLPSFLPHQIEDPIECMTDQDESIRPSDVIRTTSTSVTRTSIPSSTFSSTSTSISTKATRPELSMKNFMIIISQSYKSSYEECIARGGVPFIPQSQEEYEFFKQYSVSPSFPKSWYPLSDDIEEGVEIYGYSMPKADNPFEPKREEWDYTTFNTEIFDCVIYTIEGFLEWSGCTFPFSMAFFCQEKNFDSCGEAESTEYPGNGTTKSLNATTKRPKLIAENFFTVNNPYYQVARNGCIEKDAVPFVPKSEEEYQFLLDSTVSMTTLHAWIPLHDFEEEGVEKWDDGTLRKDNPFEPKNWGPNSVNTEWFDCVSSNHEGMINWLSCSFTSSYVLLCVRP